MAQKKSWTGVQIAQAVLTGLTLLFLMIPVVQMCFTAFMKNAFRGFKAATRSCEASGSPSPRSCSAS